MAFREFVDHPLRRPARRRSASTGCSGAPFRESVHDAHSLYFETLAELGIVGFGLLCALLAGVLIASGG